MIKGDMMSDRAIRTQVYVMGNQSISGEKLSRTEFGLYTLWEVTSRDGKIIGEKVLNENVDYHAILNKDNIWESDYLKHRIFKGNGGHL